MEMEAAGVAWRSTAMVGSATLAIAPSSTAMTTASTTASIAQ